VTGELKLQRRRLVQATAAKLREMIMAGAPEGYTAAGVSPRWRRRRVIRLVR
jgi:hypothetical protein